MLITMEEIPGTIRRQLATFSYRKKIIFYNKMFFILLSHLDNLFINKSTSDGQDRFEKLKSSTFQNIFDRQMLSFSY